MTKTRIIGLIDEAYKLRGSGDFVAALKKLEPLLVLEPPPATALVLAAECLRMTQEDLDLAQIEAMLRMAIGLAPDCIDAKLELGHFLSTWREEAITEARSLLAEATYLLRIQEHSASVLDAQTLLDIGEHEKAAAVASKGLERNPDSTVLRGLLSTIEADRAGQRKRP